jgi:HD-like signal output (HDOD) protein
MTWIGSNEFVAIIQRIHRQVGVALAKKWEMPEPVCRSIKDCDEYDNSDRLSVANAVRFANAVAKQQGLYVGQVDADDIDALVMIGRSLLGLEADVVARLTDGLKNKAKDSMA